MNDDTNNISADELINSDAGVETNKKLRGDEEVDPLEEDFTEEIGAEGDEFSPDDMGDEENDTNEDDLIHDDEKEEIEGEEIEKDEM
ncbi:MAG TPA: hypothetical protein VGE63_01830 [Candidatus Paceibacterota bacterium]